MRQVHVSALHTALEPIAWVMLEFAVTSNAVRDTPFGSVNGTAERFAHRDA